MRTALLALLLSLAAPAAFAAPTTVIVVRHAEKAKDPGDGDPELTPAGQARAESLARTLRSLPVSTIYSTRYRRNRATAAPLATARKLEVQLYEAHEEGALARRIREAHRGETVVVVAHSDTVPALLEAFGAGPKLTLGDRDYDGLWVVRIEDDGRASRLDLHHGAPNP
jgi:broad specificity phosphatase PhoE